MRRRLLLGYQLLTGLPDAATGVLLIVVPATALHLMGLHAAMEALPYLSYIGVFVLSTGVACLYGGLLAFRPADARRLEVVWILTAITRGLVAAFVIVKILSGVLEAGWIAVALTDGTFAMLQAIGLARGWLSDVAE